MTERSATPPEQPRASLSLHDVLSEHAVAALDRLDVRRDPAGTCAPRELARMLTERGLPVHEPVLELEARAGGVTLGGKTPLVTYRALSAHPDFGRSEALVCGEELLLPIDGSGMLEFWMDREGTIYRGWPESPPWDPEDSGFCAPIYASYTTMFERFAFQREPWWGMSAGLDDGYRCSLTIHGRSLGDALAQALEVPAFRPAWDRFARIWHDRTAHIEEANVPGYRAHTRADLLSTDQLVRALEVMAPVMAQAPLSIGLPEHAAAQPGEREIRRFRCLRPGDRPVDVLVHGGPGKYRIEIRPL
ncbi:uncharacterized protein SOCEGT47_009130 [Sorangium cellulosum]|uniref:Uncharacterized protein n=1 Tax=Sorangium cellulosum TaxID=56 RepID=A0A4P2PUT6_SORCE|nr:hypothetical protein [Sorangium cellulosum]AUX20444.1 uncharacterized protein SOCEGT47_009130 [Sorangium cellulosum]